MARPRRRRPTRRRRDQERHVLARIVGADHAASPAEAWKCECGAGVLHWIESIEVSSTLLCATSGTRVSDMVQTLPQQELVVPNEANVMSHECRRYEHGQQTHSHHVASVETVHGALTTQHLTRQEAITWLRAQGFDFEDEDLHDEDFHDGEPSL